MSAWRTPEGSNLQTQEGKKGMGPVMKGWDARLQWRGQPSGLPRSERASGGGRNSMVPRDYVDEVISSLFEDAVDPKSSVVGVGGAGGRMVSALYDREMNGVETVAVNTDAAGLSKASADVKVLLPHSDDVDRIAAARASAESQEPELRASLSSDIVFVVAGLGGGAGTGAAPIVARAARANGAVTIGIAILPFESEGRSALAQEGLEEF